LGPSHHFYLSGCALSQLDKYETPLGDLVIDKQSKKGKKKKSNQIRKMKKTK